MRRLIAGIVLGVSLTILTGGTLHAADCEFRLGFKTLRDLIGHDIVGECLENEYYNAIGDSNQHTTGGLMAWRKADNWTAFTDGYRTWINGPNGLVQRLNTERFPWEADHIHTPPPTPTPATTAHPQPSIDPTLAHAYHIMRRSPTGNQVADTFVRLGASVQFGTDSDSLTSWSESPPSIRLHERYRRESYEMQAFMLIYPTVLMASVVDFGQPQSWEQCMSRRVEAYTQSAKYWLETYGARGKQNPTEEEKFANAVLAAHLDNGIRRTLSMDTICEQFGVPSTPTPTPTPRPAVDSTLANAFQVLRQTKIGNSIADEFVQLGASAVFGNLDGSIAQFSTTDNRITIDQSLRSESLEILAKALVWPTMGLVFYGESGSPESWEECMERRIVQEGLAAQYWLERYGENGKRNPNERERWANWDVEWYTSEMGMRWVWLSEHYRNQCEDYGDGPFIDPELADAYRTAMLGENKLGIATVDVIVSSGADVRFDRTNGPQAYFSPSEHLIVVDSSYRGQSKEFLAALLIHETYHVEQHHLRGGYPVANAAECLQEEVNAFRLEASWWYETYGRYGKRSPNSAERSMNGLMRAWLRGDNVLRDWVILSEGYQQQCLGGVVN